MELAKKDFTVIILSFCIIISAGFNIFLSIQLGRYYNQETTDAKETLIVGMRNGPTVLDPLDCWESAGTDVIRQVAEPLWYYNLTDINMGRINMLAESEQWLNTTALSVILRQGVRFHDRAPFNAEAVKWNIDRMLYLTNSTGEMPFGEREATPTSLYKDLLGNPLIASFEVTGKYSGIIHLLQPFSSLMNLMCFTASVMLSPTAHAEEEHLFIDLSTGDLVGTGPFKYDEYIADQEVKFTRWDEYWQGPAVFRKMKFKIIDDEITLNYELLTGKIDYLRSPSSNFFEAFKSNSKVNFYEHQKPSFHVSYLGFNNKQINVTWRKAISYALNYTYIIKNYYQSRVVRAYSPISSSFGPYFDPSLEKLAPYCNYTIARQIIIDELGPINSLVASLPNTLPGSLTDQRGDDDAWENVKLVSFNFTYFCSGWSYSCNPFYIELYNLLNNWLSKIGINITDAPSYRWLFIPGGYDELGLYWGHWGPDYHDPMNMIQPIISNISVANIAQVNDPLIEAMITEYITDITLNETEKIEIIHNITKYLATILYPHAYCFHDKIYTVHAANLYDISYNSLDEFYAYPIKRNLTYYSNNAI